MQTDKELGSLRRRLEELLDKKHYRRAIPVVRRIVQRLEKAHDPDHAGLIHYLWILAFLHRLLREYHRAIPLLKRALAVSESAFGVEHERTLSILGSLAVGYLSLEDYVATEAILVRLFEARAKVLDPADGEKVATLVLVLVHLVDTYDRLGDFEKGELYVDRACSLYAEFVRRTGRDDSYTPDGLVCLRESMALLMDRKRRRNLWTRSCVQN